VKVLFVVQKEFLRYQFYLTHYQASLTYYLTSTDPCFRLMKKVSSTTQSSAAAREGIRVLCATLLRWYLYGFVFLLPFKFGTFAGGGEQPDFPLSLMEWLIFTCWPSMLPGILAGIALLLACLIHPPPRFSKQIVIPGLSLLMIVASLAGFIQTTEWGYALNWFWHFWGIFCMALAVYWVQDSDERLLPGLLNCIAAASLICCLHGWRQHFGGLEANRRMMEQNALETGQPLSRQIQEKLMQTRSYGSFVDPNIYAGHLLLTCPLLLIALRNWARRIEPQRLTQGIFLGCGSILFLGALVFSGSRGALVGFAAGVCVLIWLCPLQLRWRIALLTLGASLGIACVLAVTYATNRDLLSASVRLQYYQTSLKIFQQYPLTGAGLGEFFPWHMRLKPALSEEARDPHSLFFALLGQCGIPGLLTALLRILFPFALVFGLWRKHRTADDRLFMAVCCAWCAWLVHAQFQFNDTIPGTSFLLAFAGLWAFRQQQPRSATTDTLSAAKTGLVLRLGGLAAALLVIWPLRTLPAERELQRLVSEKNVSAADVLGRLQALEERLHFSPTPCRIRGDFALHSRDFAQALAANRELVRRTPHRSSSWCRLAKVQLLTGHLQEAEASLEAAELWYPYNPRLFPLQGILRLQGMPDFLLLPLPLRLNSLDRLLNLESRLQKEGQRIIVHLSPESKSESQLPSAIFDLLNQAGLQTRNREPVLFIGG